jgi:hypothetical protein
LIVFAFVFIKSGVAATAIANLLGLANGIWLEKVMIQSTGDMNADPNPTGNAQDAGWNPAKLLVVVCKDDTLKAKLQGISGPDFAKNIDQIKSLYGAALYVVEADIVRSENKTIVIDPKNSDSVKQDIYENAKFVLAYASYQSPGNHCIELNSGETSVTIIFGKVGISIAPKGSDTSQVAQIATLIGKK